MNDAIRTVNDIITASSISTYMTCPKKYDYSYNELMAPDQLVTAFAVGGMVHVGLEAYWLGKPMTEALRDMAAYRRDMERIGWREAEFWQTPEGDVEIARCTAYVDGYYQKWKDDRDDYEVLDVEKEFHFMDPDFPNVSFAGKMDVVLRRKEDNQLIIMDHKTAGGGSGAGEPGSPYWQKLTIDNQVVLYLLAGTKMYQGDMPIFVYDVVLKTSSKPLGSRARMRKDEDPVSFAARKKEGSESVQEYAQRIRDSYRVQPERYVRREVNLLRREVWDKKIDLMKIVPAMVTTHYTKNSVSCVRGMQACPFLPLCTTGETRDGSSFTIKPRAHMELSGVDLHHEE